MRTAKTYDTSIPALTAEGIAYNIECAGIFVRGCAYAIDFTIQKLIIIIAYIIYWSVSNVMGTWGIMLLMFVLDWFYHVIFEMCFAGQSPGKKFMGLRVVMYDATPLTFSASLLRNLLRFADVLANVLYIVAAACIAYSTGFRRIGDFTAGTLVIRVEDRTSRKNLAYTIPQNIVPVRPKKNLTIKEKETIMMFARRYNSLGKERCDEIADAWVKKMTLNSSPSEYVLGIALTLRGIKPQGKF
ncbi:MAG: RDD family protein [Termitinemataceae bacterium]|nr:MAG: RDD family protein [Termitinemataceae bacterium]